MIIAIPYEHGEIDQHFGKTKFFKFYLVEDKKVTFVRVIPSDGEGHAAISSFLKQCQVDTIICGNIGAGALRAMELAHIDVYGGVEGNCDDSLLDFINGELKYNKDISCTVEGDSCCNSDCSSCSHDCYNDKSSN